MNKAAKVTTAKAAKKPKEENPLVLNAEVIGGSSVLHRRLGRIVRVTKTLLTVEWTSGSKTFYSRKGRGFNGSVDKDGEAITEMASGKQIDDIWDDEDTLSIATESAKRTILEEQAKKDKVKQERAEQQAATEADPVYQKRQADLKRYAEALRGLGANVENGWNDQKDFRIELDGIKPDKMEELADCRLLIV